MTDDEKQKIKRYTELAEKSYTQSTYYFTDFLSPADAGLIFTCCDESSFKLWGGDGDCERVMARFGNEDELGYEVPFPIAILSIRPLMPKFSDELTHRDFLGALMNLGIERAMIGDITVRENCACTFVHERISGLIKDELTRVKHTSVKCDELSEVPVEVRPVYKNEELIVSSLRLDGVISKLYHLPRTLAKELFADGKIFINSRLCINPAVTPKEADIISVRGFGKFKFHTSERATKKGNLVVIVEKRI